MGRVSRARLRTVALTVLLTWRYAHALRRPTGEPGTSYDGKPAEIRASTRDPAPPRRAQTAIARFTQTSPTSMPTF
jgi:hypothetical protein